eukprot:767647-Hanusia_phi.AAC.6
MNEGRRKKRVLVGSPGNVRRTQLVQRVHGSDSSSALAAWLIRTRVTPMSQPTDSERLAGPGTVGPAGPTVLYAPYSDCLIPPAD